MTPYRFVHVTTPLSEDQQAEIIALWQRGGAIIEDTESRLDQVSFVAYTETDEIVGVASCQIQPGLYSDLPVHTLRVFVAEHHRQSLLAFELLAHLGEALIDQSRSKGLAQAVGLSTVIETDIVNQRGAILCSRTFQFAINKFPVTFLFTGFSREGSPEYTHYFELGDLERNTASKEQPATPTSGMDLVFLGPESAETLKKDVGEILIEQRGIPSPQARPICGTKTRHSHFRTRRDASRVLAGAPVHSGNERHPVWADVISSWGEGFCSNRPE